MGYIAPDLRGETLQRMARATFETDKITPEQLKYVLTMSVPSAYLLAYHTVKGHPITFSIPNRDSSKAVAHRPWQTDIINDQHPNKVVMKSRQLGLSEIGVAEMLWFADRYSANKVKCMYAFPTYRQLDDFIKTRLDPVIHSGYYSTILSPDGDSVKGKRIRDSFLLFRSASKASSVEGVDIDYLSLDEYDRVSSSAEESAIESMSSSNFKIKRRWSTPTTPNYGIHDLFEHSDKKHYLHECAHCHHWNKMSYDYYEDGGNIKLVNPEGYDELNRQVADGTFAFVCNNCGNLLDRWYNGKWVADAPHINAMSGYFISQLNAVWVSADDLKRKELVSKSKQTFYNYVIGVPYQDIAMAIVERDIENTLREDMPDMLHSRGDYTSVVVGIDWGEHFHWVVVMGRRANGLVDIMRVFNVKSSKSNTKDIEADIKSLIAQVDLYSPDLILADIGFSGNYIAKLINAFGKHRTFGVQVNPAKSNGQVHPVWNENGNKVTIDKLTQNTIFIEAIKTKRVGLWSNKTAERSMFTEHWTNVVIRDVEDERTGEIQKEITRKGDDHWAQASVYANVAMNHIIDNVTSRSNAFNYTDVSGQDNLGF